jgi:hypothetical protein
VSEQAKNGRPIVRIGRKGRQWFALGEEGEPFEVDVVAIHSQWVDIDRTFRNEKNELPLEKIAEANAAAWQFVHDIGINAGLSFDDMTLAEALEFICKIAEETDRLKDFFVPKLSGERSSPESTELTFSE